MGRMADIWKSTDRGPATPLPTPGALLTLDPAPVVHPELTEDDDIPFIEVGGPRPIMKHLEPIAPKKEIASPLLEARPVNPSGLVVRETHSVSIMSVRFESVHAGRIAGRGFGPEFVAFHQPDHVVSIQYRSLVAEIVTQLPGTMPRALLIVSTKPGVGASTVVLNLGVTIARQDGMRVTVVDTDFSKPDLSARLGIAATPGIRD